MECSLKNIVSYRIAGHTFMIKGGDSVRCVEKIPGFDVFACETMLNEQPFVINLDEDLDFNIENPVYEVSNDGYDSFFGVRDGVFVFEVRNKEKKNFHFCMEYHDNEIFASSANDEEALRFALWFAFNFFGSSFGAFGVHSSCIVYDNAAVLFLGESGTGKSTHTRLWYNNFDGAALLNDDSPIVSTENGIPVVFGSPWSGKTPCYKKERYPLKGVVRLRQAPENKIKRLNVLDSIAALYPSFPPAFAKDSKLNGTMLTAVSNVISKVPVYQLDCLPDVEAALLSRKTIFGK